MEAGTGKITKVVSETVTVIRYVPRTDKRGNKIVLKGMEEKA